MIDEELKEENLWVQIKITYVYKDFTREQLTRCTLRLIENIKIKTSDDVSLFFQRTAC